MVDITTRRAIEICMSRLPMDSHTRSFMAYHLASVIEDPKDTPTGSIDGMRAVLEAIIHDTVGPDMSYAKKALIHRLVSIRSKAQRALTTISKVGPR